MNQNQPETQRSLAWVNRPAILSSSPVRQHQLPISSESEAKTEISPDFKRIAMNRKQTAPQMTFAQAQDHLRQLCEGEGIPGWGPVHQHKPLDRFGKIRDAFEDLRDQLEADPDYTSFTIAIQKVLDQKASGKRSPLSDPKFRERLTQLYNDCKGQRKRILALYSGMEASLHQLRKYLLNPEEEPRKREAIDEALQSWYIAQDLFDPFNSYNEIVKESPSDYFGDPTGETAYKQRYERSSKTKI